MSEHLCESCGHPVHHCKTAGQSCSVQALIDGALVSCRCPSTAPSSPGCSCHGELWWLRQHSESQCNNDYPRDDPNCCPHVWDALPADAQGGRMGWELRCHKRNGHGGYHSTHNECGAPTGRRDGSICGCSAGTSGSCELHESSGPER